MWNVLLTVQNMLNLSSHNFVIITEFHFRETLVDYLMALSPKKLKSLNEIPNVVNVKVHVLSFSMILTSSP